MKAVIYARYSSDTQREESIEGQLRECKAYAEKTALQFSIPISTAHFQQRQIIAHNFKK